MRCSMSLAAVVVATIAVTSCDVLSTDPDPVGTDRDPDLDPVPDPNPDLTGAWQFSSSEYTLTVSLVEQGGGLLTGSGLIQSGIQQLPGRHEVSVGGERRHTEVRMTLTDVAESVNSLDGPLEFVGEYYSDPVAICGVIRGDIRVAGAVFAWSADIELAPLIDGVGGTVYGRCRLSS